MATIGIDLGNSNSVAAVLRGSKPVTIRSAEGATLGSKGFPSCVAINSCGQTLVGELARRELPMNPTDTCTGFRGRMGRRVRLRVGDHQFTPQQLSAFLLSKIKHDAEVFLGEAVRDAVITVPAHFDGSQRRATRGAAKSAGFESVRLVPEPLAACIAHGLDRRDENLRVAVLDLGAVHLDVTIVETRHGVAAVKATRHQRGGSGADMDHAVFEYLAGEFQTETDLDVRTEPIARARLLAAAELAKIELSVNCATHVSLPFLAAFRGEPHHLECQLTRATLERIVQPLIERWRAPVGSALRQAGLSATDVDKLILAGGPVLMPCVRTFFENLFRRGAEPGPDPREIVAHGAALATSRVTLATARAWMSPIAPSKPRSRPRQKYAGDRMAPKSPLP